MAKAILEYDLDDVEDKLAHKRAIKSTDMALALWEISYNAKKSLEWSFEGKDIDKYDALEIVFDKIFDILEEHNINLGEIID